jgi:hypothetical protein
VGSQKEKIEKRATETAAPDAIGMRREINGCPHQHRRQAKTGVAVDY